MAALAYAVAVTVTLLSFSPGAGLCIQMPDIEPFWLLYPDSFPPHPALLSAGFPPKTPVPPLPDPLPELGLVPTALAFEVDEPQPEMTRTGSAIATEQTTERQSFNIRHPQPNGCGLARFFCQTDKTFSRTDVLSADGSRSWP